MVSGLVVVPVALDSRTSQAGTQGGPCAGAREGQCHPRLERLSTWLKAARQHEPGANDSWALEIGGWTSVHLDEMVADVRKLQQLLDPRRRGLPGNTRVALYDRRFTLDDIEEIVGTNATLLRGATLHADVATFVHQDASRQETAASTSVLVRDGTPQNMQPTSVHWRIARSLLDEIRPSPSKDASALLWYRAYSAHFLRERQLNMAQPHLDKAIKVFPSSWEMSLDNAYLHERFAAPSTQAARMAMTADGITSSVGSDRVELELAANILPAGARDRADDPRRAGQARLRPRAARAAGGGGDGVGPRVGKRPTGRAALSRRAHSRAS